MSFEKRKKSNGGKFVQIPHALLKSSEYINLSSGAKLIMVEAIFLYNGINNGDICLSMSVLKERGFKSNSQRVKVIKELVNCKFLIKSKQGTRHPPKPDLYALSWKPIDECGGKLDIKPTTYIHGIWRMTRKGGLTLKPVLEVSQKNSK